MLMLEEPSDPSIIVAGRTADLPRDLHPLVWEITEANQLLSRSLNTAELTTARYAPNPETGVAAAIEQVQRCVGANAAVR